MNFQTDQQIDLIVHLFNLNLQTQFSDRSIDWFNWLFIYPELKKIYIYNFFYVTKIVDTSASRRSIHIEKTKRSSTQSPTTGPLQVK